MDIAAASRSSRVDRGFAAELAVYLVEGKPRASWRQTSRYFAVTVRLNVAEWTRNPSVAVTVTV